MDLVAACDAASLVVLLCKIGCGFCADFSSNGGFVKGAGLVSGLKNTSPLVNPVGIVTGSTDRDFNFGRVLLGGEPCFS